MSEEIKGLITSLTTTIEQKSGLTTKEIAEIKSMVEAADKKHVEDWDKLQGELKAKDATVGQLVEEVKELKAKNGRKSEAQAPKSVIDSIKSAIADAIEVNKAVIIARKEGMSALDLEIKAPALVTSANLTGSTPYRTFMPWQPGMEPVITNHFRDFVRTVQSETDNVDFPRANIPIGEGSFGRQLLETDDKQQVDRDYTMINLKLLPVAGWINLSRASLRNIIFLQSWLPTSLTNQLEVNEDTLFTNDLLASGTGAFTGTGAIAKIVGAIADLVKRGYNPGRIPMDSAAWAALILNQSAGTEKLYNLPNVVTVDAQGATRVLGREVVPVPWLSSNYAIVGDWSRAAIVESEGLTLRQSDSHNGIFIKNQVIWLLERVEGLMVNRPDAFTAGALS